MSGVLNALAALQDDGIEISLSTYLNGKVVIIEIRHNRLDEWQGVSLNFTSEFVNEDWVDNEGAEVLSQVDFILTELKRLVEIKEA